MPCINANNKYLFKSCCRGLQSDIPDQFINFVNKARQLRVLTSSKTDQKNMVCSKFPRKVPKTGAKVKPNKTDNNILIKRRVQDLAKF